MFQLTRHPWFRQSGDIADQIRRAALSVSNTIAEGFERGSTTELIASLYIARGSAGEVRSILRFLERLCDEPAVMTEVGPLVELSEQCSRQLRGWADSLQNSEIQGQKHLTDVSRAQYVNRRKAADFRARIEAGYRETIERWSEGNRREMERRGAELGSPTQTPESSVQSERDQDLPE